MLFHLIATLMMGVGAASVAFILMRLTGGRLPRFIIPFGAGLAMIAYNVWNESTWFGRTVNVLPKQYGLVAPGPPGSSMFAPWTYAFPRIDSFRVADRATIQALPTAPDLILVQMHDLARFEPTRQSNWVIDCARGQFAELTAKTTFDEKGVPGNITWVTIPPTNHAKDIVCPKPAVPLNGSKAN